MEQPYINLSGLKLAYRETNPQSDKIIFFIHGNSISSLTWKKQLSSPLLPDYRLIALDLPAHGASDGSANPEQDYSVRGMGRIVANAVKMLAGSHPYILAGVSLGSCVLAESLAFGLNPAGIVLAGSCVTGGKYTLDKFILSGTSIHVVFTERSPEREVRQYASEVMVSDAPADIAEFTTDYYAVKPSFRSTLSNSIQALQYQDEITLVQNARKPILLIFGQEEKAVNPDYLDDAPLPFWKNTVFKLPGASHLVQIDQPEAFNQLIAEYAREMFC